MGCAHPSPRRPDGVSRPLNHLSLWHSSRSPTGTIPAPLDLQQGRSRMDQTITRAESAVMTATVTDQVSPSRSSPTIRAGKLGALEIVRELGSGAMGDVFEARDPATGTRYVVKTLRPE